MTTEIPTLEVTMRSRTGKGVARAIRRAGFIPAVIYGNRESPVLITLDPRLINVEMNKPGFFTRMFDLALESTKVRTMCRDLQRHPVSSLLLHADFQRVSPDSMIHVAVPVHVINEIASPAVKRGGVVNLVEHTIVVVGRPAAIPAALEIDLAGLKIGDSIHLSQVKLPEGVRLLHPEPDLTIATIVAPSIMESGESIPVDSTAVTATVS